MVLHGIQTLNVFTEPMYVLDRVGLKPNRCKKPKLIVICTKMDMDSYGMSELPFALDGRTYTWYLHIRYNHQTTKPKSTK